MARLPAALNGYTGNINDYGMAVSRNGASTIQCHMTVTNFTATSYWIGPTYNFPSNGNNTSLSVPAPAAVPNVGGQSLECNLPPSSYLFMYSYEALP